MAKGCVIPSNLQIPHHSFPGPAAARKSRKAAVLDPIDFESTNLPAPKRRAATLCKPQSLASFSGGHQSTESKLLVASAPLRSADSDGCGDTDEASHNTKQMRLSLTLEELAEIAMIEPMVTEASSYPKSGENVPLAADSKEAEEDEIVIVEHNHDSDSGVAVINPLPSPEFKFHMNRMTCDWHVHMKKSCSKIDPMCMAHRYCRNKRKPNHDPESLFITCQRCTDCFLHDHFSLDPEQHRTLKTLADESRAIKGQRIDSMRMIQGMLLNNAALLENLRVSERKRKKLSTKKLLLHKKRQKTTETALQFEQRVLSLEEDNDYLGDLITVGWGTIVLDC